MTNEKEFKGLVIGEPGQGFKKFKEIDMRTYQGKAVLTMSPGGRFLQAYYTKGTLSVYSNDIERNESEALASLEERLQNVIPQVENLMPKRR